MIYKIQVLGHTSPKYRDEIYHGQPRYYVDPTKDQLQGRILGQQLDMTFSEVTKFEIRVTLLEPEVQPVLGTKLVETLTTTIWRDRDWSPEDDE